MKRLLSLLLTLTLLLMCAAWAEGVDYTGTWVLTGADIGGMNAGPSLLAAYGISHTITLNADGTAIMHDMDDVLDGSWVATENGVTFTFATGESDHFAYRDGMIIISQPNGSLLFTREDAAPAIIEVADPVAQQADYLDFEGEWILTKIRMMGADSPAELWGTPMTFHLEGGGGMLREGDDEDGIWIGYETIMYPQYTEMNIFPMEIGNSEENALKLYIAEEGYLFMEDGGRYLIFERQVEDAAQ